MIILTPITKKIFANQQNQLINYEFCVFSFFRSLESKLIKTNSHFVEKLNNYNYESKIMWEFESKTRESFQVVCVF